MATVSAEPEETSVNLTPRQRVVVVAVAFGLGAAFELVVTGGSIDAPSDRLAIYYATAFPWATVLTVLLQLLIVALGHYPEGIDPLIIGVAGGIQGALVGAVVLLLLLLVGRRRRHPVK